MADVRSAVTLEGWSRAEMGDLSVGGLNDPIHALSPYFDTLLAAQVSYNGRTRQMELNVSGAKPPLTVSLYFVQEVDNGFDALVQQHVGQTVQVTFSGRDSNELGVHVRF